MRRALLVLLGVGAAAEVTVPVGDANFYFSDYNWFESGGGSSMVTANPGATAKLGFANSSYVTILLNTSRLAPPPAPFPTLKLAISVDVGPWRFFQLSADNRTAAGDGGDIVELTLAASDATRAEHEVVLMLFASTQLTDRWLGGGDGAKGSSYLEVGGARLASGGASVRPASLRPRRLLFYGDSITEGTNAHYFDWRGPGACVSGNELHVNCAPCSWGQLLAGALDAEASQVAFAAAGFSTHVSLEYGNVPPLLTVGDSASSSWDKVDGAHSRLGALSRRPPDYVFSAHGNNDQACGGGMAGKGRCTFAMVTSAVTAWLSAMRAATSPETRIVLIVPFGGDLRSDKNKTRSAIRAGFEAYQARAGSSSGGADPYALMIDLYPSAERLGLSGGGKATAASCDGTHPLAHAHAQLASMIAIELGSSARLSTRCKQGS